MNLNGNEKLLDSILALGLDGIEAFSSYHTTWQAEFYYEKTLEHGLIATCGSDFHGKTKPSIQLGSAVSDSIIEREFTSIWHARFSYHTEE